jgi:conjugal transfer pilus assembly protein TraE
MDYQSLKRSLTAARRGNLILGVTSSALLVVLVLLSVMLVTRNSQVILVPTSIRDGMVARGANDKRYIEALALDTVYGLYNASPKSLSYGRAVLERVAAVSHRAKLLQEYDRIAEDMRERDISTAFYPNTIEHHPDKPQVIVEGKLNTYLDTTLVATEPRRVMLTFKTEAGSARLASVSRLEVEE